MLAIPIGVAIGLLALWTGPVIDSYAQNTTVQTYVPPAITQEELRQIEVRVKLLEQRIKEQQEELENETH